MPKVTDSINVMQVVRDTKSMCVTFNAVDRASEKVIRTDTYSWAEVHETCKKAVMLYGLIGFLRDRKSGTQGVLNRLDAYQVKFDETLLIGNWAADRATQGKRLNDTQAEVLAKHYKVSMSQVKLDWAKLSEDRKEKVLASPTVIAALAKIAKAPKKVEGISFDDLVED